MSLYFALNPETNKLEEPEVEAGVLDVIDAVSFLRDLTPLGVLSDALEEYAASFAGNDRVELVLRIRREERESPHSSIAGSSPFPQEEK